MKNLFFIVLWILSVTSFAQSTKQGKLTGTLVDSTTTKPVPYATITIKTGSQFITGTTTDSTGTFVLLGLPMGQLQLTISFVGYKSKTLSVSLTEQQPTHKLRNIQLSTEGKTLVAVNVVGQKALVEDKGDRLVYNAEKDISNAGGTAADVLRKVPTLTVDATGNVQMRGSGNIKVLINGKPSTMMARNLSDALRQLPANSIKSVEVITSPGAKYDAEGAAGIINIITKKALQGVNGSVNAALGSMDLNARNAGVNLTIRGKKLGMNLSVNGYQSQQRFLSQNTRETLANGQLVNTLVQQSSQDNLVTGGYGNMSIDYDLDSTNRFNASLDVWGGYFPNNSHTFNVVRAPDGSLLQAFRNDVQFANPFGNGQFDLGYTKTFPKRPNVDGQREFSLLGQYSRMPDNYTYTTNQYGSPDATTYNTLINRQHSTNYSRNKELTIQADYVHPFTWKTSRDTTQFKVEVGVKSILRNISSEFRVEQASDTTSPLVEVPSLSNDFAYRQHVYSGYSSLTVSNRRKWTLTAGARLEHTAITGDFKSTNTQLNSSYNNLIPSFILSKGIGKQTVKVSYTQRIQRPLIWYLNPWINQSDPKNISTGNPYLNPELSHATELGHSITTEKGLSINSALYWRQTNNAIVYLITVDTKGVATNRPENIGRQTTYGLNVNVSGEVVKGLNLNIGPEIQYTNLQSPDQQNSGWIANLNANLIYKINPRHTLQFNSFVATKGMVTLQSQASGWYYYQFSGKREFWDKKASLTLRITNPFGEYVKQSQQLFGAGFVGNNQYSYVNRQVQLAFEFRFGQLSTGAKQSKKITNDDRGGR